MEYFLKKASKLIEGIGCPICSGHQVYIGINDIATVKPEITKLFKNPSDVKKYTKGNNSLALFKCPNCGHERYEQISQVVNRGHVSCPKCSDGISYPNKFARAFLDQLNVNNIIYEYSPNWIKPYRYDTYFEFKNEKYILEMDGGFHYIKYYKSNLSLDETQKIDLLKDDLAKSNNIIMIRINCFYSEKNFIIKNIKKSILSELFDLSIIDWNKYDHTATKSLIKEVCDYYNRNSSKTTSKISEKFKLSPGTISKYLYKGNELGICNYKPKNKIPIKIIYNNLEYYYNTIKDCIKFFPIVCTDNDFIVSQFKTVLRKKETEYKNYIFVIINFVTYLKVIPVETKLIKNNGINE